MLNARLRVHQGGPRGAPRRRPRLHDVRAGDDRVGRLADERLAHAGPEAVLRRHVLPAGRRAAGGRASRTCCEEIAAPWRENRDGVVRSADAADRAPAQASPRRRRGSCRVPGPDALAARGAASSSAAFDRRRGGFGGAPKFPRPDRTAVPAARVTRAPATQAARDMAVRTLRAMADGGMRDHVGGGFHRYSVDADWRVPHFEKMLYDQAQLVLAYLEARAGDGRPVFADVADDTLRYVAREMTRPGRRVLLGRGRRQPAAGARRHTPARTQVRGRLLPLDGGRGRRAARRRRRRSSARGSASSPTATRRSIRTASSPARTCSTSRAPVDADRARTAGCRSATSRPRLRARAAGDVRRARAAAAAAARRQDPHGVERPDDRRLRARGVPRAAERRGASRVGAGAPRRSCASTMWDAGQPDAAPPLPRRRARRSTAYAEDYACLVWGLLELFQADGDPAWLEWALELQRRQDELFWDDGAGGWFSTTGADPSVLLRMKEDYDGAEPSATSVAVSNLIVLAHLTGDADVEDAHRADIPGSRGPHQRSRPQRADDAGRSLGVARGRAADRDRGGCRRCVAGGARARGGGTLPAVRGRRAHHARGTAAASWRGRSVHRGDEHARRSRDRVRLPRLRVPGAASQIPTSLAAQLPS